MHSASKASGDARRRVTAPSSSDPSAAAVASAQWDCTSCNATLQEALRRDRPSRLMQAVQAGMIANNTAAQEQPAAYNDFDCGTTVSKALSSLINDSCLLLNVSSACLSAACAIVL
jgi:hypothetical protein